MKSILVDALRQANGDDGDKALSDSGSFEASREVTESPANDVLESQERELELMTTTNALVLREDANDEQEDDATAASEESITDEIYLESEGIPVDDEHAVTIVGMTPLPIPRQRIPRLARFAPLLCAVLAVTVAGSWVLVNKLGISRVGLGTVVSTSRSADSAAATGDDSSLESRFPFLDDGQLLQAGGTRQ